MTLQTTNIGLERYAVGDCEMLARSNGTWIRADDLVRIIDWLTDEDQVAVMLTKLDYLREALS